ncbi:hypothetical protein D3C78_681330 [compost metagenome]
MTGEDEVGRRRQHFEAQLTQLGHQLLAAVDHLAAGLLEIGLVLECDCRAGDGHAVQRIGVEAVLDPLQRLDQVRMPYRQADPQARQGAGFGQGLGHQQIGVAVHQGDRRIATEIDIRLVHHHHRIRVGLEQLLHGVQRQQAAGGRVGIGEDDAAVGACVVLDPDLELLIQRYRLEGDAIKPAVDRVEAVGHVGEQQRLAVLEQAVEGVGQHLVRAIADEHLARLHTVVLGHRMLQAVAVRVRVEAQVVAHFRLHGRHRLRRRTIGILVGVQLDQFGQLGLFARNVGHQVLDEGTPELAHAHSPLILNSALRAWAVSDSPRASTDAVLPSSEAPSAEQKMIDERFWKS